MLRTVDRYLVHQSAYKLIGMVVFLVAVLGVIDYSMGPQLSFSVFYVFPILLATWYTGRTQGVLISIFSAMVWLAADLMSGNIYSHAMIHVWNAGVRFSFFIIISFLTSVVKKKLEAEEALADTDYLTGLKNSRAFYEHIESEAVRSRRYRRPFTLAYIDLDNFKFINDTYGHDTGDEVLKTFSEAIRQNVRQSDVISRLGGDEFAGLFPETDFDASEHIMQNLLPVLTRVMTNNAWQITFSVGAVTFENPLDTVRDMLKKVDDIMYRVKKSGKDNIVHIEYG